MIHEQFSSINFDTNCVVGGIYCKIKGYLLVWGFLLPCSVVVLHAAFFKYENRSTLQEMERICSNKDVDIHVNVCAS